MKETYLIISVVYPHNNTLFIKEVFKRSTGAQTLRLKQMKKQMNE